MRYVMKHACDLKDLQELSSVPGSDYRAEPVFDVFSMTAQLHAVYNLYYIYSLLYFRDHAGHYNAFI